MSNEKGVRGLAIHRASFVATERATRERAADVERDGDAPPLFAYVAVGIPKHLAEDMREAVTWAKAAVDALRQTEGYDHAVYGTTDDEIADAVLAAARARKK